MSGWVYILTNKPNGILYTGVTIKLPQCIFDHRNGQGGAFTRKYKLHRLVYVEEHERIEQAIQREAIIKSWPRAWKVRLITGMNPNWDDLYENIL
jgi:putative endonuclease